ncbi:Tudor domain containing protein [Tritrichomonas foetus]|uniref:Tudor domain containing protein n=1 Tax=Tritrichomonas foetus TaxID=1144522 RepID=A0A1J4K2J3_9EUKA|nr:Tudor domain containing protein [Tritrichomonas foetus]|eukprot:OHT05419.1 Tudor domain containing protein [Tritrichomonas foetus]
MTFRGIVNGVLSGDSLLIRFLPPCPTPLQIVSLENVCAPRYGSNNGDKNDEPHGCESFEFLRKLCIGQRVSVPQTGRVADRSRGHSIFGKLPVVFRHVTLCDQDNKDIALTTTRAGWTRVRPPKYKDEYVDVLLEAQTKAQEERRGIWRPNGIIRQLPVRYDPEIIAKTKYYNALVEGVLNGTTLTLFLQPRNEYIFFQIAGCMAPSTRKDNTAEYGQESREFIARCLLDRIIRIQICDYTDNKLFIGCILGKHDVSVRSLISNGLAKFRSYLTQYTLTGDDYLRAENEAKKQKMNLWCDFSPPSHLNFETKRFTGRVYSIINSNIILVFSEKEQRIRKVHLNFIRVPPFCSEPFGFEAREFLRKLIVGKNITAVIDGSIDDYGEFGTVFLDNVNINEELCKQGLACTVESPIYGYEASMSPYFDKFVKAENEAKRKKLNIWADKQPAVFEFGKVTTKLDHEKGVIERCLKGCRFIVSVPSKKVSLRLGLNGITPSDDYVEETKTFCGNNFTQRDVIFDVSNFDKSHLAYSNLKVIDGDKTIDVAAEILANGFAEVNPNSPHNQDHIAAQNRARHEHKGIWKSLEPAVPPLEYDKVYRVNIEKVIDPLTFVVHHLSEKVEEELQNANKPITFPPSVNELVVAKTDRDAFLAVIESVNEKNGTCHVSLIEYKSENEMPKEKLFELPESLKNMEKQTKKVHLGCLCDPIEDLESVRELIDGAILYMHLMYVDDQEEVLLTDSESITSGSLNAMLINMKIAKYKNADINERFKTIVSNMEKLSKAIANT